MTKLNVRIALPLFLLATALPAAPAETPTTPAAIAEAQPEATTASQEDTLYAAGTKAMDEQRWADAVSAFDRVVAAKGKRVDAAMYWKAYSLDKLGRKDEARAECNTLAQQQPSSTWNKECFVLRAHSLVDVEELRNFARAGAGMDIANLEMELQNSGEGWGVGNGQVFTHVRTNRTTSEDDIKLLALNSLMRQDPAKALPLLRDLVHSNKPLAVRKEALFVLSRSKQPEAQTIINQVATNKADPEMQRQGVQLLALNRGKDAGPTLVEVYRGSTDAGVKHAAINGLYLTHDASRLVELARGEKDLNLKRDIVSQLAVMKDPAATDYMLELLK